MLALAPATVGAQAGSAVLVSRLGADTRAIEHVVRDSGRVRARVLVPTPRRRST
jgi:hypothetical protein